MNESLKDELQDLNSKIAETLKQIDQINYKEKNPGFNFGGYRPSSKIKGSH